MTEVLWPGIGWTLVILQSVPVLLKNGSFQSCSVWRLVPALQSLLGTMGSFIRCTYANKHLEAICPGGILITLFWPAWNWMKRWSLKYAPDRFSLDMHRHLSRILLLNQLLSRCKSVSLHLLHGAMSVYKMSSVLLLHQISLMMFNLSQGQCNNRANPQLM